MNIKHTIEIEGDPHNLEPVKPEELPSTQSRWLAVRDVDSTGDIVSVQAAALSLTRATKSLVGHDSMFGPNLYADKVGAERGRDMAAFGLAALEYEKRILALLASGEIEPRSPLTGLVIDTSPDPTRATHVSKTDAARRLGVKLPTQEACLPEEAKETPPPVQRQQYQEQEILRAIRAAGYEPLRLPSAKAGTPGAKAAVRKAVSFGKTGTVFDKAWERLRKSGQIQDAT
jgi:hypothetical protein